MSGRRRIWRYAHAGEYRYLKSQPPAPNQRLRRRPYIRLSRPTGEALRPFACAGPASSLRAILLVTALRNRGDGQVADPFGVSAATLLEPDHLGEGACPRRSESKSGQIANAIATFSRLRPLDRNSKPYSDLTEREARSRSRQGKSIRPPNLHRVARLETGTD